MEQTKEMRSSYMRSAFGTGALYLIYAIVQSLFVGVGAAIIVIRNLLPAVMSGDFSDIGSILSEMQQSGAMPLLLGLMVIGMTVGMIVGILVFRAIRGKATPIEKRSIPLGQFLLLIPITFRLWAIGVVLGNITTVFGLEESTDVLKQLFGELGSATWPLWLYTCIGAPLFEELALRKVLLDRLHPYGHGYAALVSGLLFGLIHGNSGQFFLAFAVGVLFALIYLKTGRVIYSMILHFCINTLVTLPEILLSFGIDVTLVWNWLLPGVSIVGIVLLIVFSKRLFGMRTARSGATSA